MVESETESESRLCKLDDLLTRPACWLLSLMMMADRREGPDGGDGRAGVAFLRWKRQPFRLSSCSRLERMKRSKTTAILGS